MAHTQAYMVVLFMAHTRVYMVVLFMAHTRVYMVQYYLADRQCQACNFINGSIESLGNLCHNAIG